MPDGSFCKAAMLASTSLTYTEYGWVEYVLWWGANDNVQAEMHRWATSEYRSLGLMCVKPNQSEQSLLECLQQICAVHLGLSCAAEGFNTALLLVVLMLLLAAESVAKQVVASLIGAAVASAGRSASSLSCTPCCLPSSLTAALSDSACSTRMTTEPVS